MITRNAPYFKDERLPDGRPGPAPLPCTVERTVRFEEVDALNVMWHGRYPSYFEDARVAFGQEYGFSYRDLHAAGHVVPIKQMGIDYVAPLRFGQHCRITCQLHWTNAAKLNFSYSIKDIAGQLLTTGYTVQLFLTRGLELCLFTPDYAVDFRQRWRAGQLPLAG
jgi:acyl-CoA thioester hydrolase